MKLSDIDHNKVIRYLPKEGKILLGKERMILVAQSAFQHLWKILNDHLGLQLADSLKFKFGFECGYNDFHTMMKEFKIDSEEERLALGPLLHTLEGVAIVEPIEMDIKLQDKKFYFKGKWIDSFEGSVYINNYGKKSDYPTCFSLTGYASGWCSAFAGFTCIASEIKCSSMGDPYCEWIIRDIASLDDYGKYWLKLYEDDQKSISQDLERLKHEAEAASEAKSNFLAVMGHEMRTPLNVIIGISDLITDEANNIKNKKLLNYTTELQNANTQLLNIINSVLDITKMEQSEHIRKDVEFNLKHLIQKTIKPIEIVAKKKGIKIETHFEKDLSLDLFGDAIKLKQILNNLISNSVKFSETGTIKLEVKKNQNKKRKMKGNIKFIITDQGIGIPIDKREEVFEKFQQADDTISRKYGGSGLGLTISREFADLLGGEIYCDEAPHGKGTRFVFTVDFCVQKECEEKKKSKEKSVVTFPLNEEISNEDLEFIKGKKILVVDDSEPNLSLISMMLEKININVSTVTSGFKAIEEIKKEKFDLILMDVMMPEMDGLTTTTKIRDYEIDQNLKQVPIIAFTANAFEEDIQKSLQAGCNGHLSKPVKKMALYDQIIKFLKIPI